MKDNHNQRSNPEIISDELLSAYLDDEVTAAERARIERALAQDKDLVWRLDSLRQTVVLVQQLPRVAPPRSFTLRESDVAPYRSPVRQQRMPWWQSFFSPLVLRNASALAALLLFVLLAGDFLTAGYSSSQPAAMAPKTAAVVQETVVVERNAQPVQQQALAGEPMATPAPAGIVPLAADTQAASGGAGGEMPPEETPAPALENAAPPAADGAPSATAGVEAPAAAAGESALETAPIVEITSVPGGETNAAAARSFQAEIASTRPWLRLAQIALGLLTVFLFVAWRRTQGAQG